MGSVITRLWGTVQDLRYYLCYRGPSAAGKWLWGALRTLFHHRIEYLVLARSVDEPLPSFKARLPITCRVAEPDGLSCLQEVVLPSEFERLSRRLAHGRVCHLALHRDNLAACGWTTGEVDRRIDNLELHLGPGDAYIDDLYTLPAWRRQGIQAALHTLQLKYLQEQKVKRAVAIVAVDNIPSLGMFHKFGYREVDRLSFRRVLFWREYRYHNGRF